MRPRQLEYVVAVAEEGSFTEGARAVLVSQPALSHQVKALEQELGRPLFVRGPDGARLTPHGERFLPHARAALAASRAAVAAARDTARLEGGELRVAALHSMAMGLVPPALGAWRLAHPAVRVALTEYAHIDLLTAAMAHGDADIGVGTEPAGWSGPLRVLGEEELMLVLPADDPLLRRPGGVPLELLADRPWVLYAADFGLAPLLAKVFAHAGFVPRAAARVHHTATAVELAAAGLGPALVPADVIGARHAGHSARPAAPILRRLVAFTRDDPAPAARAFADLLAAHARPTP
ncbi:DNA-binding transcriptional LysR family regulator [Actinocorallia herbida]|uniref:DNA-binding transcriptional LysR family regulator n=1 Tax=Actinocorallia herbida TaxID=58109 RepID=A0A3N1D577_9ACTN|nr:LysR family transcriptional regulator [Actinocorallia herbida]ROO88639.1 DNA-binding transcriptional LysR family regulator [Actinocorallia herbida]